MLTFIKRLVGRRIANRARALAVEFHDQAKRARSYQRELLLSRIARNADSAFGRDHGFHEIRSPEDFRKRVPIGDYNSHEPYIDRVRNGDVSALFGPGTEVLMFAMTSGTTNRPKTIPVTREAVENYRHGWLIWGIQAFDDHPEIIENGLRPILQIASDWRESYTSAGIPCGAITGLTASMQSRMIRTTYCMPPCGSRIKDVEAKYYLALRSSVFKNLGTIIAANPSTILNMVRLGDRERETLIRDIHDGTIDPKWAIPDDVRKELRFRTRFPRKRAAKRLEAIVQETGRLLPKDYWPDLEFLSNWMGGTMRAYLRGYPEYFDQKPVRDVGLIASEGRMTIPIEDGTPAGVLDIRHHYFEFIAEEDAESADPQTIEAADLVVGKNYFILLSTAGGLYRYNIFDLVRCVGFHHEAPIVEFLNKGAHFSSLTGEKISEHQVVEAVEAAQRAVGLRLRSYLLLPVWGDPPSYGLLVEASDLPEGELADRFTQGVEAQLRERNVEYAAKRDSLRLGPVRTIRIQDGGWADFQRRRLARSGGTVEQYKQPHLIPDVEAIHSFPTIAQVGS